MPQEAEVPQELTPEVKALMAKGYQEDDCKVGVCCCRRCSWR